VGEDQVHYEGVIDAVPQVDQVYLEPADYSVAPRLYPIRDILTVNGRGFRAANYQAVASPARLSGKHASLASTSATPELSPYNDLFPPLRVVVSSKRKRKSKGHATKRKSRSPSPPKHTSHKSKAPTSNSTAKLAKAQANLAAATAALAKAQKLVASTKKRRTSP
jgi:hypothetical protein